jgi:flagellar basal-body rod protein FlgF
MEMSDTMAMIEASMRADAEALRVVGQNIANAEVTAYRRQIPVQVGAFDAVVGSAALEGPDEPASAPNTEVAVDVRSGTLEATGQPLDVAIEGGGFFVLQATAGPLFTRRGDFRVAADGTLTSASGHAVLGANGPIHVGAALPAIGADGTVRVGTEVVDQLQLQHFADESKLQYLGSGVYADPDEAAAATEGYSLIRQGFLETSNVVPVTEMVQLMETMRRFETAQRLARGYDQMIEKAISELGKTS